MASNFRVNGTDLDDIYANYTGGTKPGNTGYQVNGTDLKDRYQPVGSGLRGPHINTYDSNGTDLSDIFGYDASYYITTTTKTSSTRTAAWTGAVDHWFRVTFASTAARSEFFLYSGQIRVSASRSGGSNHAQNTSITNLLNTVGTLTFEKTRTNGTGSTGVGNDDLTSSFQTCAYSAVGAGTYANDSYRLEARAVDSTTLEFKVTITETNDSNPNFNESVDGTLISRVGERRFNSISSPSYSTTNNL